MKKKLFVPLAALFTLMFLPCLAAAAPNCPGWLGTWEVKNTDNSTRIWKIYEADNDTGLSYIQCKAKGYSETPAGTDRVLFSIIYMEMLQAYGSPGHSVNSYTEETVFSGSMKSREMNVDNATDNFTSWPSDNPQYPVERGIKTSSDVPDPPDNSTDNTTTTTVPCALTVIPKTFSKVTALVDPIQPFIIRAERSGAIEFSKLQGVDWNNSAISSFIRIRLGNKLIFGFNLVRPLQLVPDDYSVTVTYGSPETTACAPYTVK